MQMMIPTISDQLCTYFMSHDYIEQNDDTETGQCFALFLARTGSAERKMNTLKTIPFEQLLIQYMFFTGHL